MSDMCGKGVRDAVIAETQAFRRVERARFLAEGPTVDHILDQELRCPGSDTRHGVAFIVRPAREIVRWIQSVQARLRQIEPSQYFYPPEHLHATILTVRYSVDRLECEAVATRLVVNLFNWLQGLKRVPLEPGNLTYDRTSCAVPLLPCNERLGTLRAELSAHVACAGLHLQPRHTGNTTHVTFLRYLSSIPAERWSAWLDELDSIDRSSLASWDLDTVWLSWGRNWYGRRDHILTVGPFQLQDSSFAPDPL